MEKLLVAVFDNEPQTYEGSRALKELDTEGSITIYAESVIKKNADGTVSVMQAEGDFPVRTVGGTAVGSLIGLLGGPVGFGIGAVAGALAGSIGDLYVAGVNADFLDDVSATLTPGKCAVVADVSEEWVTPVDSRMEAVGGVVFRSLKTTVEDDQRARDVAEFKDSIGAIDFGEILENTGAERPAQHALLFGERIEDVHGPMIRLQTRALDFRQYARALQRIAHDLVIPKPGKRRGDAILEFVLRARDCMCGHCWFERGNCVVAFDPRDLFDQIRGDCQITPPRGGNDRHRFAVDGDFAAEELQRARDAGNRKVEAEQSHHIVPPQRDRLGRGRRFAEGLWRVGACTKCDQ